jgi:uncharacterized membrane protein YfcA
MNFNILGNKGLSHIMEISCTVFQALGTLLVISLPWTINYYLILKNNNVQPELYYSLIIILFCSGICGFCILHHLKKVLHNVNSKNPFTYDTARRIKFISYWCLPVALIYLIAVFFIPSAFAILVSLTFLFLSACIFIIAELFYQAINYKQENDLTI